MKMGGEREWNFLWARYQDSNVAAEKASILSTLACSRETWILNRYYFRCFHCFHFHLINAKLITLIRVVIPQILDLGHHSRLWYQETGSCQCGPVGGEHRHRELLGLQFHSGQVDNLDGDVGFSEVFFNFKKIIILN